MCTHLLSLRISVPFTAMSCLLWEMLYTQHPKTPVSGSQSAGDTRAGVSGPRAKKLLIAHGPVRSLGLASGQTMS